MLSSSQTSSTYGGISLLHSLGGFCVFVLVNDVRGVVGRGQDFVDYSVGGCSFSLFLLYRFVLIWVRAKTYYPRSEWLKELI